MHLRAALTSLADDHNINWPKTLITPITNSIRQRFCVDTPHAPQYCTGEDGLKEKASYAAPNDMVRDKTSGESPNTTRPLMPTLATKRSVKSPITPRLATTASSPLLRTPTQIPAQNSHASGVKSNASRDERSTPIKSFLTSNVTPRSSSRKSRAESAHSTPGAASPVNTPTGSRPVSVIGVAAGREENVSTPMGQQRPENFIGSGRASKSPAIRTSTFLAGRTKPAITSPTGDLRAQAIYTARARSPERFPAPKRPATFFYADGQQEEGARLTRSPSPALSAVSTKSAKGQFFHADGTAEEDDISPLPPLPKSTATSEILPSSALRKLPPLTAATTSHPHSNFHLSYRKGVSQILKPGVLHPAVPAFMSGPQPDARLRRRSSSIDLTAAKKHNRTSSLGSLQSSSARRVSQPTSNDQSEHELNQLRVSSNSRESASTGAAQETQDSSPRSPFNSQSCPLLSIPTPLTPKEDATTSARDSLTHFETSRPELVPRSVPQSPTKLAASGGQSVTQLVEIAANARRERKVLDLEISNSSLLVINRQLEKEVRKQKAELRRFRRLTRAGRLSSVSVLPEDVEATVQNEEDEDGDPSVGGLAVISEDDYSSEDDLESDSGSSADSSILSPSALAEKDANRLERDSKRLQIDLSKHRQLLIDSQKMNQSLKRCIAWTEEMIREGKKQLDYRVRVSDVHLGGRVLAREVDHDDDDGASHDHGLLGPWSPKSVPGYEASDGILGMGIAVQRTSWQSENDSGVEVESARLSDHTHEFKFDFEPPSTLAQPAPDAFAALDS